MTKIFHQNIVFALLFAIVLATPSLAYVSTSPSITASILNYEPVPATPGSLLDVYVQIQNNGTAISKVFVTFEDNAPFSIETASDRIKTIESLPGQQAFLLKYRVRVSSDALPGTSYIKLMWKVGESSAEQSALLPIDVTGNTVSLTVENVKLTPEMFTPGTKGELEFWLHNNAQLPITAGSVKLDLDAVDLVPIGGTNQQRFTELNPGESRLLRFVLAPTPSATPGVYKVPVNINFTDKTGKTYAQSEYIGMVVGARPDVSITIEDSKVTSSQEQGDVTIRVTNKGLGEIKFVDVILGKSDSYEIVSGSSERYVGNIDSDDYKTARITVLAKGTSMTIPITVTYMDALNTPYNTTVQLTVPIRSDSSGGSSTTIIIVVIVVLAIGGYFLLRRRGKDRK